MVLIGLPMVIRRKMICLSADDRKESHEIFSEL